MCTVLFLFLFPNLLLISDHGRWFVGVDLLWYVYVQSACFLNYEKYYISNWSLSSRLLLEKHSTVRTLFEMTTISNIYRSNKCDVWICCVFAGYILCCCQRYAITATSKCRPVRPPQNAKWMKWNGHVWDIHMHVREYIIYICVCAWQIIIHAWLKQWALLLQLRPDVWILAHVFAYGIYWYGSK